ncbi:MAG: divergent polysaccharide deacetylase family protein [Maricaulaceae bacterium]
MIAAIIFTICIFGGSVLGIALFGQSDDAVPHMSASIDAPPMPPLADSLNGESGALPDLLGDTPAGTNPTEQLDALGNPIPAGLAGTPQTDPATSSNPLPRVIKGFSGGLIKAPIQGLSRTSPYGPVPAPSSNGRTPAQAYAKPFTAKTDEIYVSLIIGGLGINRTLTTRAIEQLPANVTLSFAAHAPDLQEQINAARAKGHEVLLEIPMESETFNSAEPGANHTLRSFGPTVEADNLRHLDWLLSRAAGYFAVTNYNGSQFLPREDMATPFLKKLADCGIGFIFDGSFAADTLAPQSQTSALPFTAAQLLIDVNPKEALIRQQLAALEAAAQSGGNPIGMGFTYPQTLSAAEDWARGLSAKGLTLAPASHVMDLK